MKYIDKYVRTKIIKAIEPGKPMPKGGFWYVYAVWSGRPLTHTYSFKPHAHLMAILLPQKKVKTERTLANCPKHLTKA